MTSLLVIYAYHEGWNKEEVQTSYKFFMKNAYFEDPSPDRIHYIFVINGECTIPLIEKNNITIIRRENIGFDFGAYKHVLDAMPDLYNMYDYYFFVNSSVRGPFLLNNCIRWYEYFIRLFKDDVKLVGCTIGFYPGTTYIESYAFMLNNESLNFLKDKIFNRMYTDFKELYTNQEFGMTRFILDNGWNINALVLELQDIDYRDLENDKKYNKYKFSHLQMINGGEGCNGRDIHPYEVMFAKINRPLNANTIKSLTSYNLDNFVTHPYNYNPYEEYIY